MLEKLSLLLKYIFLGLFQGITEPIPVSSSGHLLLLREVFNIKQTGLTFEIFVNTASFIAIFFYYRKELYLLFHNAFSYLLYKEVNKQKDFKFFRLLILTTLITGLIGLFLEQYIQEKLNTVTVVGLSLLINAIGLWIIRNLRGYKGENDITFLDACIIGIAQSIALIPGISRSGATIITAMLIGIKREVAFRFSFFLYLPISFGIFILSFNDLINNHHLNQHFILYFITFIAATTATFYALKGFKHIFLKGKLSYFAIYCFIVGLLALIFL